jgi:hypothetical protein
MTKFDDYDFHIGDAVAKGRPADNAFTHIGFMLAWLVRHDLCKPMFFAADLSGQLSNGRFRPNDLRDLVDGKLLSDTLTNEGSAFLAAYYDAYIGDFDAEFADAPDYGVSDDAENEARIDRRIDAAFERWTAAGRPKPQDQNAVWAVSASPEPSAIEFDGGAMVWEYSGPEALLSDLELPEGLQLIKVDRHVHLDRDLEARIAAAIGQPMDTDSRDAKVWSSSTLNRSLRVLGVAKTDVVVATANGEGPRGNPWITVIRVPGVDRARLFDEFRPDRGPSKRLTWQNIAVAGIPGLACTQKLPGLPLHRSYWLALDDYSVDLGSDNDDLSLEAMVAALLGALRA